MTYVYGMVVQPGTQGWIGDNRELVDAVNVAFVELFGRNLIGDGIQTGQIVGATGNSLDVGLADGAAGMIGTGGAGGAGGDSGYGTWARSGNAGPNS